MHPFELNLRHFRALVVVRDARSLTAAAEMAGLSQPALTQGLRRLEAAIGVNLFERRPGGVIATAAGLALCARVERAFEQLGAASRGLVRVPRGFAHPERLMTGPQLRALLALADGGSFVAGSAATGKSQPALHRAVRDLERVGGASLVERRGRGVALTDLGRRFARAARLAAAELAAGIEEAAGGVDGGVVTVGTMPLARARVLPAALSDFVTMRPGAIARIVEGSWRELVEPLRDGSLDMMVGAMRDEPLPDLDQEPLFEDEVVVVGRAGHPLAGAGPAFAEMARWGWLVPGPGTPLRARWEALFADLRTPVAPIECGSTMVTRGVLGATDLLALVSPDQISVEVGAGLLAVIHGPLPGAARTIGLVTRAGWRPTATQRAFVEALRVAADL